MTPAEHVAAAERLLSTASRFSADPKETPGAHALVAEAPLLTAQAKVHALLALAPTTALPPTKQPPPARVEVFDVQLYHLAVTSTPGGSVVLEHPASDWSTLLDNPAQVRLLADTLTAHADRMENR